MTLDSRKGESHNAVGSGKYKTITRRIKDNGYDYAETTYIL